MLRIPWACRTCAIAVAVLATSVHAAETLTLNQSLDMAERAHPHLEAGIAQVAGAQAGIVTAKAYPNPESSVLAGRQGARVPGAIAGQSYFYSFSQPLELGALRPSRIQLAERGRESSEFALAEIRLGILSAVRRAYYQVLHRKSEIQLAAERLKMVEDLRRRVQVRVDVGEAGRLELLRAEAETATARTLANSAQLQLVSAFSQLRAAVAAPLPADLDLEGGLEAPPVLALDDLRKEVLEHHPSLALAQAEVRRANARVDYELALRRPQPSLRTEIDWEPDNPTYRAGLSIPMPFWNRREGPIAEASAARRQTDRLAEAQRIEILAGLEGAYGRYQVAGQQISAFEQGVLREADQALQAAETAYQLGERGIIEVLDAQRVLHSVRLDYLTAQYERQDALIDINQLRAVDLRRPIP
jgi:cobalt-zinc-cadmium efflux system outer membrane protein